MYSTILYIFHYCRYFLKITSWNKFYEPLFFVQNNFTKYNSNLFFYIICTIHSFIHVYIYIYIYMFIKKLFNIFYLAIILNISITKIEEGKNEY
jgi:hypothetical protein